MCRWLLKSACRSPPATCCAWRRREAAAGVNPNAETTDDVGARGSHRPGGGRGVGAVRRRGSDRDRARPGAAREVAAAHGERHVAGGAAAPGRSVGGSRVLSAGGGGHTPFAPPPAAGGCRGGVPGGA